MANRKRNAITAKKVVRLTPAQERVQIAADALAQVKLEVFKAESGTYVQLPDVINTDGNGDLGAKKIVECLITDQTPCTVCAKGALFISTVRRSEDNFIVDDLLAAESDPSFMIDDFDRDQLDLIESYFEGSPDSDYFTLATSDKEHTKREEHCERFYDKNPDAKKRLIKILENIIKNEGEFIPSKLR